MTRRQRHWHLIVWLIIGPLTALGLVTAIVSRPAVDHPAASPRQAQRP